MRDASRGVNDGELLRQAAAGAEEACAELVDAYWPALHRVALLILRDHGAAEDIAQETMLTALQRSESFNDDRPLRPWLLRIATNKAIDSTRRRVRRPEQPLEETFAAAAGEGDLGGLRARLESLDRETRAIVALRYVFDYRAQEIGEIVGLSAGAVRSRLSRALKVLRVETEEEVRDGR